MSVSTFSKTVTSLSINADAHHCPIRQFLVHSLSLSLSLLGGPCMDLLFKYMNHPPSNYTCTKCETNKELRRNLDPCY